MKKYFYLKLLNKVPGEEEIIKHAERVAKKLAKIN